MRTVKDLLANKPQAFNIIGPGVKVIDALSMLNSVDLSYLVVMDGGDYKGIFCERDYTRNVILKGRNSSTSSVKDVMTIDLPIVHLNETVEHCMHKMISHKTRYLLAYDADKFAGVITIHDLLRQVIMNRELVFDNATAAKLLEHEEKGKVF
ncbi:MAG: CBS domain-containing protein [Sphingobacteriales bacterium]|nr:MAG: CBS domain-containing protein [Sphingobacteriales bacterium]